MEVLEQLWAIALTAGLVWAAWDYVGSYVDLETFRRE